MSPQRNFAPKQAAFSYAPEESISLSLLPRMLCWTELRSTACVWNFLSNFDLNISLIVFILVVMTLYF